MTEIAGDVAVGRHVTAGGNAEVKGSVCIEKDLIVKGWLDAPNIKRMHKGFFSSEAGLVDAYPRPQPGWWALVGTMLPAQLYLSQGGSWRGQTDKAGNPILTGEPTLELVGFREELDSIPCDFVYDEEASGISNCIIKLVLKNGSSLPLSLPKASMTAAGIIRAGSYKKYEEASVNGINAINWLNDFKAKTAEDFSDVYTMMRDYADGEEFYYFKQETQNQLDLLDRKIDTVQGLHNQDMDSIADEIKATKYAVFDDLFLAAVGSWGTIDYTHVEDGVSKPYYLNELWLTYEEAVAVMDWGAITTYSTLARYKNAKIRTNLPPRVGATSDANTTTAFDLKYFDYGSDIEILNLACEPQVGNFGFVVAPQGGGWDYGLSGSKLRKVLGIVNLGKLTSTWNDMLWTPKLEEIRISHLKVNFSFRKCPLISAASLRYLIGERSGTNAITVTVHEEVYAKLTGDPNSPYLIELTVAELQEWMELVELATTRNITFACA